MGSKFDVLTACSAKARQFFSSDSQFSPGKISPRHISPDISLLEIIIQEHISPGILSSTDIYLQVILRFLPVLFYPAHFSLGRKLTSDKVL